MFNYFVIWIFGVMFWNVIVAFNLAVLKSGHPAEHLPVTKIAELQMLLLQKELRKKA